MPTKKPRKLAAKPLDKAPAVPSHLKGQHARAYWKRLAKQLVEIRALTPLHLEALEVLCDTWQTYRELIKWYRDNPHLRIIEYASGHEALNLRVTQLHKAQAQLEKLWAKFGLTPDATNKVTDKRSPSSKPSSPVAEFAASKHG